MDRQKRRVYDIRCSRIVSGRHDGTEMRVSGARAGVRLIVWSNDLAVMEQNTAVQTKLAANTSADVVLV